MNALTRLYHLFMSILPFVYERKREMHGKLAKVRNPVEYEKIMVDYDDFFSPHEKDLKKLHIERKYGLIDDYDYEMKKIEVMYNNGIISVKERKLKEIEIGEKYGKIDENKAEKERATLEGKPWVKIKSLNFVEEGLGLVELDIDYNSIFIDYLKEHGFTGRNEYEIIDAWFRALVRNIVEEEFPSYSSPMDTIYLEQPEGDKI